MSCSVKKVLWDWKIYFCLGIWSFLDSTTSAGKKSCSIESGSTKTKLVVGLKIYNFTSDIEVFWILIKSTKSDHSFKIVWSVKDLPIFLGNWGVSLWCYLLPEKMEDFFFIFNKLTGRYSDIFREYPRLLFLWE